MHTTIFNSNGLKKNGKIYEVVNNLGKISVIEHDCYVSDKNDGFFYYEDKEFRGKFNGLEQKDFCASRYSSRYDLDEDAKVNLFHTDKNKLISKWNEIVDNDKLRDIATYEYTDEITTFSQILELANKFKESGINCEYVMLQVKDLSQCPIKFSTEPDEFEGEVTYYFSFDDKSKIEDFVEECDWDESVSGDGTLEQIEAYLAEYGIDLGRTYFIRYDKKTDEELSEYLANTYGNIEEGSALEAFTKMDLFFGGNNYKKTPVYLLNDFSYKEGFIYELIIGKYNPFTIGDFIPYFVAHKITNETNSEWICNERTFAKQDMSNLEKFEPFNCHLYGLDPKEIISLYNKNLDKFKI